MAEVACPIIGLLLLLLVAIWPAEVPYTIQPPISDAEFVARCTPETTPWVALRVRRIIADNFGLDYNRVYPSHDFRDDFGVD